tara:strand:+ start:3826 stop:3996 length:171 start_codon:yes stop_codon:yes gene_type:complete
MNIVSEILVVIGLLVLFGTVGYIEINQYPNYLQVLIQLVGGLLCIKLGAAGMETEE